MHHYLFAFILFFQLTSTVFPRSITRDDFAVEYENVNLHTEYDKDNLGTTTVKMSYRILKDGNLSNFATFPVSFNGNIQQLRYLKASVTDTVGKTIVVPDDRIEVKPVGAEGIVIAPIFLAKAYLPTLSKGSLVNIEFSIQSVALTVPGIMTAMNSLFDYDLVKKIKITYSSPNEIIYDLIDDGKNFAVKSGFQSAKKQFFLEVQNTRPLMNGFQDEDNAAPALPSRRLVVSNLKKWEEARRLMTVEYEKTIQEKLPETFKDLVNAAKKIKDTKQQIKFLIAELGEKIYYVQSYTEAKSSHIARSLADIASTKYGDCKDYSVALVAMLRSLGIESNVGIIEASQRAVNPIAKIPSLDLFNHAIVYAKVKDEILWLDPTQKFGYVEDTPSFLANRDVMVLSQKTPVFIKTPDFNPQKHRWESRALLNQNGEHIETDLAVKLTGHFALKWTSAEKHFSRQSLEHALSNYLGLPSKRLSAVYQPYELKSRIYEDLKFEVRYLNVPDFLKTSMGIAILWEESSIGKIVANNFTDRVSDLDLGLDPSKRSFNTIVNKSELVGTPKECEVSSPWYDFKKTYLQIGNQFVITEEDTVKKRYILNAELKAKNFLNLKNQIDDCGAKEALLFKWKK